MVGYALTQLNASGQKGVPAHRVVNRNGELSGRIHFKTPTYMQELLEKEGVRVVNNKIVDFEKVVWHPENLEYDEED